MYIVNGIAYASEFNEEVEVADVKILDDYMMIVHFSTGEMRLFDATSLFKYPAFKPLEDETVFKGAVVEYGVVTWKNGEIDFSPETMYRDSYTYEALKE